MTLLWLLALLSTSLPRYFPSPSEAPRKGHNRPSPLSVSFRTKGLTHSRQGDGGRLEHGLWKDLTEGMVLRSWAGGGLSSER